MTVLLLLLPVCCLSFFFCLRRFLPAVELESVDMGEFVRTELWAESPLWWGRPRGAGDLGSVVRSKPTCWVPWGPVVRSPFEELGANGGLAASTTVWPLLAAPRRCAGVEYVDPLGRDGVVAFVIVGGALPALDRCCPETLALW